MKWFSFLLRVTCVICECVINTIDNRRDSPDIHVNHKNYNFLDCDWFKKILFSPNSLAKLLSDSLWRLGRAVVGNGRVFLVGALER